MRLEGISAAVTGGASGLGLATANHLALCRLTLIPAPAVGLVTGVQNVSTSFAGIVAPILSGWLKETSGGYQAPMQVIFVFLLLGAVWGLEAARLRWEASRQRPARGRPAPASEGNVAGRSPALKPVAAAPVTPLVSS